MSMFGMQNPKPSEVLRDAPIDTEEITEEDAARERRRIKSMNYRKAHRDTLNAAYRQYYRANSARIRAQRRARAEARLLGLPPLKAGRRCAICLDPRLDEINAALASGQPVTEVAIEFQLSYPPMKRHRRAHVHIQTQQEGTTHD